MAAVEGPGIPREERAHAPGERAIRCPDQGVSVVREQGPGVDGEGPLLRQAGQASDEVRAVGIIPEDGAPLEPPRHHVAQGLGGIEPGLAGQGRG